MDAANGLNDKSGRPRCICLSELITLARGYRRGNMCFTSVTWSNDMVIENAYAFTRHPCRWLYEGADIFVSMLDPTEMVW